MTDAQEYQQQRYSLLYMVSGKYKGGEAFSSVIDAKSEREAMKSFLSGLGRDMNRVTDIEAAAV